MLTLTVLLVERAGLIIILAFFLVNIPQFRKLLFRKDWATKLQLFAIFATFTIIANLIGIELLPNNSIQLKSLLLNVAPGDSVANIRILTVTVSGIIGGPLVGGGVGLVAGAHRMLQESLTADALFYIPSSMLIGILSGLFSNRKQHRFATMKAFDGFLLGFLMESIQMAFILLFSPTGWTLVKYIALPMMLVGALGTSIFLSIIGLYFRQEVDTQATQTKSVLQLALKTLPIFRQGLNPSAAKQVVNLILEYTNFDAVGITDETKILAFEGAGQNHHVAKQSILTELSEKVIQSGEVQIGNNAREINCPVKHCPLHSAIAIPLIVNGNAIGSLKLYYIEEWRLSPVEIQLGIGLGEILAMQIMLGEMEHQSELIRDAEIKSLQSQVNPHFFFNAINTIVAVMRYDSDKARDLLIQLSTYFRANLMGIRETTIPLYQEFAHVKAYLSLEQTRFPDRFKVVFQRDVSENAMIPPFTIQVIVENAIRHAFNNRKSGNLIQVQIKQVEQKLEIRITDNGLGVDTDIIDKLGKQRIDSKDGSGTALQNLNSRLVGLYGKDAELKISSSRAGTQVVIQIPYNEREKV